jgi:hypothetical protein
MLDDEDTMVLTVLLVSCREKLEQFLESGLGAKDPRFSEFYESEFDMRTAVAFNGLVLQFATDQIKDNYEIVKQAVYQNGRALQYATSSLRENIRLIKLAIHYECSLISEAPPSLFQDIPAILDLIHFSPGIYPHLPAFVRDNHQVLGAAMRFSVKALK